MVHKFAQKNGACFTLINDAQICTENGACFTLMFDQFFRALTQMSMQVW